MAPVSTRWNGKQKPLEPGCYWYRADANSEPRIRRVERHQGELGIWTSITTHGGLKLVFDPVSYFSRGEWSTRIPEPEQ